MLGKLDNYMPKKDVRTFSNTVYKINLKCIKDLNLRLEAVKLLEEDIGSTLFDISLSNNFLDLSPQARETKAIISKCDLIKRKNFCTLKEIMNQTKRQPTEWEKIYANDMTVKCLISKIYKELIQLNNEKINNLL